MRATADKRLAAPLLRPVMGRRMTVYGVVCAASLACYFNALSGDFVHDDIPAVTKNHDVVGTTPVLQVFANDFWGTPMSDPNSHKSYRPLTIITFRANYLLSGLQPVWFHGFNILLHAASCVLFTRISLVVAGLNSRFGTAAGLLFAVHPIHTEAVSGIVGRADVLACLLFLLSFLVYHDDSVGCTRKHRLLLSSILAALSMLAKETGITVLLVNLLYDLYKCWPHVKRVIADAKWNEDSIQFARRAAKIFMAMSVLLVFRLAILQGSLPKFSNQDNPTAFHPCPHVRLLTFCYLAAFNCWLLLCPSTLSHDWQMGSIPLVTSVADCRNIATCFFFGCCLLLAYRCLTDFEHQRHAPIVLGSLLLVIPFLPATNIFVTVGFVVAERILYIPSLGSVLLTVYGAQILYNSYFCKQKMLFFLCFLLLIGSFSYKTTDRNRAWSSRESLVRSGIKALPHNAKMHYNFANYLRDMNSIHQAISHYREALRLWPSYASAHNNLGTLMNSATEAEAHFQSAISISPGHVNAHYNLGQVYRKMNRSMEAVTMLERCLRLDSAYTPAYLLLAKLHNPTTARRLLQHVTRLHPNSPDYLAYYAAWLYDNYYVSESLEYYTKALRLQHSHMTSLIGVAKCLRARGQIGRLHQTLIRWHLIKRSHSSRGRLVYAGELYIRSWDLYKQGQTTSSELPSATIASRGRHLSSGHSKRRPKWWRHLGSCNLTENSCKHRQLHLIEQYQLTPTLRNSRKNFEDSSLSSTLCVENHDSELTARPGR